MQRLLYHAPENPSTESPFDRAIVQVVQGQEVSIVSPYIGVQYLHRLIGMSTSWRLISDVLEWLSATPVRERGSVYEFLKEHDGLVHHYPAIHAKTVVSRVGAYTGSANLTDAGVLRRTEFGVLLTDPDQVQEIQQWFDAIWSQTSPPPLQGVLDLIAELDQISHIAADFADLKATQLESGARRVRAKLVKILGHEPQPVKQRLEKATPAMAPTTAQVPTSGSSAEEDQVSEPVSQPEVVLPRTITVVRSVPGEDSRLVRIPVKRDDASSAHPPSTFDLEAELDTYISRHAGTSFTFEEALKAMRLKQPTLRAREAYFVLLESCASHPRTLFSSTALNRLVYSNGRFIQSNRELLTAGLRPVDELVGQIIDALSFETPVATLDFHTDMGMPAGTFRTVLTGMVNAGFLIEEGGLRLAEKATWSARLKLLSRAHSKWEARLAKHRIGVGQLHTSSPPNDFHDIQETNATPGRALAGDPLDAAEAISDSESDSNIRLYRFDTFFEYLAKEFQNTSGNSTIPLERIKRQLQIKTSLSSTDVSRLLDGTYPFFRSPFIVMGTQSRDFVKVVPDILDNPDLTKLPRTSAVINQYPALRALAQPPRPLTLKTKEEKTLIPIAPRFRNLTIEQADDAYLRICRWIFKKLNPHSSAMPENSWVTFLGRSGVRAELVRYLIFRSGGTLLNLFQVIEADQRGVKIRLIQVNLSRFPKTNSYLTGVAWQSGVQHECFPSLEILHNEALAKFEHSTINHFLTNPSNADSSYASILDFIAKKIPPQTRFRAPQDIAKALAPTQVKHSIILYLLGINHTPENQLVRVRSDRRGFLLEVDESQLGKYLKCQRFFRKVSAGEITAHPWLVDERSVFYPKTTAATEGKQDSPQTIQAKPADEQQTTPDFSNKERILRELDGLYSELFQIYIKYGSSAMKADGADEEMESMALGKYLQIIKLGQSKPELQPVLSLRMHEVPSKAQELVIYGSYRDHIHQYPGLQRLLSSSPIKVREV